nr:immunoglobulin light chain junction region [Macaca mulatta]
DYYCAIWHSSVWVF